MMCVVCNQRPRVGGMMCEQCGCSFERAVSKDDGTIAAVIEWAARRARWFARIKRDEKP